MKTGSRERKFKSTDGSKECCQRIHVIQDAQTDKPEDNSACTWKIKVLEQKAGPLKKIVAAI